VGSNTNISPICADKRNALQAPTVNGQWGRAQSRRGSLED